MHITAMDFIIMYITKFEGLFCNPDLLLNYFIVKYFINVIKDHNILVFL